MTLRKLFLLGGAFFFMAEPFLVHFGAFTLGSKAPVVCPSCGMKDICGPICCCGTDETCGIPEGQEGPALVAAGCAQERPLLTSSFSDSPKYLPGAFISFYRSDLLWGLAVPFQALPSNEVALLSPPPEPAAL